jgi:hypothetical protein
MYKTSEISLPPATQGCHVRTEAFFSLHEVTLGINNFAERKQGPLQIQK